MALLNQLVRLASPPAFVSSVAAGLQTVKANIGLAMAMASRDLATRYKGFGGTLWVLAHPLLQMLVFLFIFGVVFKQKLALSFEMPRDYTTYILSGLVPWLACAPAFSTSCLSILNSSALVKQFHFNVIVLPMRDVAATVYFWAVGLAVVAVYSFAITRTIPWTYLLLPIALGLTLLMLLGIGWIFAAMTVFFRDLREIVTVVMNILVYLLPIVYLPEWVPHAFRPVIAINPLSSFIWVFQDILYFGRIAHPNAWIVFPCFSIVMFSLGYRFFTRVRPHFGNVL